MMTTNAVLRTGQFQLPPIRGLPDAFELHPFDCNQDGPQRKNAKKKVIRKQTQNQAGCGHDLPRTDPRSARKLFEVGEETQEVESHSQVGH